VNSEIGQLLGKFQIWVNPLILIPQHSMLICKERKKGGLAKLKVMVIRETMNSYLNQDNIIKNEVLFYFICRFM
jgi:hypothetical protein